MSGRVIDWPDPSDTPRKRVSGEDAMLINGWLKWLAAGSAASSTIRQRRYTLEAFARHHRLADADAACVEEYLARPGRGPDARKSVLASLRSFYRWATLHGHLEHDPTTLSRSIRTPPGVPRPCPEDVLARALDGADPETELMLLLGAYAGLRRAEIARLHADAVTPDGLVVTGKGGVTRRIPVHPRIAPLLPHHGWAFPSPVSYGLPVSPDYVASRVEAALEGWTCHSLRHRFATQAYRATKDLRAVQQLLGHASPTTTARYVMVDEDSLARAVLSVA
jgi:integrase/recombinase XerC